MSDFPPAVLAFVAMAFVPVPFLFTRYGPYLRRKSKYAPTHNQPVPISTRGNNYNQDEEKYGTANSATPLNPYPSQLHPNGPDTVHLHSTRSFHRPGSQRQGYAELSDRDHDHDIAIDRELDDHHDQNRLTEGPRSQTASFGYIPPTTSNNSSAESGVSRSQAHAQSQAARAVSAYGGGGGYAQDEFRPLGLDVGDLGMGGVLSERWEDGARR